MPRKYDLQDIARRAMIARGFIPEFSDAALAELRALLGFPHQRLVRAVLRVLVLADQHHVAPGPHRLHRRLLDRVARGAERHR